MKKALLFAGLVTLSIASCKKDDSTPSRSNTKSIPPGINYSMQVTNNTNSMGKSTATTIDWTSGTANVEQVKLEANYSDGQVEETSYNTGVIDLMSETTFGNKVLSAGTYHHVELKAKLKGNNSSPSLRLTGTYNNGSSNRTVTFVSNEDLEIQTEQSDVDITNNTGYVAMIDIDMNMLMAGISSSQLLYAELTGGKLVISQSSNSALYLIIKNNLKNNHHHCEISK